ncbi:decaprenyl-phosphate phosphoribosyltransferase [Paenibacillus sp. FSL R7-0198]|uniref:decaprenyl-phosphate phosphoribosyltransferase n=1 Tax=Paenibacillus sp. FSL R7-0198 TaxID=2921674 RepID=UPI0030F988B4
MKNEVNSLVLNKFEKNIISLYFEEMRWKQWTKNVLVFAALIFSIEKLDSTKVIYSLLGFICYCLISSCIYIFNDFLDRHSDRLHPVKKFRPIASGRINPYQALIFAALLFLLTIIASFYLSLIFGIVISGYFLLNLCYSVKMKHIVILDIMAIAAGFVLRAIGGAVVINVYLTPWFLVCTMLLALFLAVNKRRNELIILEKDGAGHRKVLSKYSVSLIDQMNNIVTSSTVVSYALFTFTSGRTVHLMWTIPFVLYGIFRYLYLVYVNNEGGAPEKVLYSDKPLLITVVLYVIATVLILYIFG